MGKNVTGILIVSSNENLQCQSRIPIAYYFMNGFGYLIIKYHTEISMADVFGFTIVGALA